MVFLGGIIGKDSLSGATCDLGNFSAIFTKRFFTFVAFLADVCYGRIKTEYYESTCTVSKRNTIYISRRKNISNIPPYE